MLGFAGVAEQGFDFGGAEVAGLLFQAQVVDIVGLRFLDDAREVAAGLLFQLSAGCCVRRNPRSIAP